MERDELRVVGQSVVRYDAESKVTGTADFVYDMLLPGMIYGKILRSPHPHALIRSIDTREAEKAPGVCAVITGPELGDRLHGPGLWDEPILAKDRVRFVGEGVAAVAAASEKAAERALRLIRVEYEILSAVFDVEEAFSEEPPAILHPELRSYHSAQKLPPRFVDGRPNVYHSHLIESGSVEEGFEDSDLIVEDRYTTAKIQHCQMEPHAAIARLEGNGNVTLWANTSTLHPTKNLFCNAFQLPPSKVRVLAPNVGGGFGGKQDIIAAGVAYGLARKTGKPVKVAFSRKEVFVGTVTRHPMVIYIKDGFLKDGTLLAREIRLLQNGGAYSENGYLTTKNASYGAVGTYRIPHFKLSSYGIYTNEPISGAFRGFGNTQLQWAIECQMDVAAQQLRMDPVKLRRKNLLSEGELNPAGEVTHSIGISECMDKVLHAIRRKPSKPVRPTERRGVGFAIGNKYSLAPTASTAVVKVHEDGRVEARIGTDEVGQGLRTVIGQFVAEEFDIDVVDVEIISGDTAVCPYEEASVSSRSTYQTGNAVLLACKDAKRQILTRASSLMKVKPEDLTIARKCVFVTQNPETSLRVHDLFIENVLGYGSYLPEVGEFLGKATWIQGIEPGGPGAGTGKRLTSFYTHGAVAAEVSIDVETGMVRVERLVSAFDMGRAVNPRLCEVQIEGGVAMAIGSTLLEKMVMENGRTLNPNFTDYVVPTAKDVPDLQDQETFLVEALHKDGPFGAKGLGEATMIPVAPAIANAVYNAVGLRFKDLPLEPHRILDLLSKRERFGSEPA
jgi:CO/xanthine dehydrogenase Mo-binding subunit